MNLSTVENFLLIAHHPSKGRFLISDVHINYGIIGALLLEMSIENRIVIENERLRLKNFKGVEHPLISEISAIINNAPKPRKLKYWISKLARKSRKYKWLVLGELVKKNVMRIENHRFIGLIPYRRSYLLNIEIRYNLIQRLRNSLISTYRIRNEDVVLGLIEACKIYKILTTDRDELKILRRRLKEALKEDAISETVDQTIRQVQAAIISAIVASTVASTAGASH